MHVAETWIEMLTLKMLSNIQTSSAHQILINAGKIDINWQHKAVFQLTIYFLVQERTVCIKNI